MWQRILCLTALVAAFVPGCAEDADPSDILMDTDIDGDGIDDAEDAVLENVPVGTIPGMDQPTFALNLFPIPDTWRDQQARFHVVNFLAGEDREIQMVEIPLARVAEGDTITLLWSRLSMADSAFCGTVIDAHCVEPTGSREWAENCLVDYSDWRGDAAIFPVEFDSGAVVNVVGVTHLGDGLVHDEDACVGIGL